MPRNNCACGCNFLVNGTLSHNNGKRCMFPGANACCSAKMKKRYPRCPSCNHPVIHWNI
jgi:hypothetical protein